MQCGNDNPPSKGNKKRKYCSKKCANKYLHKKNYNNGENGIINSYTRIKKNPNWGLKTKELNERRAEFERCEADPNLFSPRRIKDEMGLSISQVSLRGKLLEIEPIKVIKYSGRMTYYSKEQAEKIKNFVEIISEMKINKEELPKAYTEYSKKISERTKEERRTAWEDSKKDPKFREAHTKKISDQWKYRKERIDKYPYVKLQRNVSLAVYRACKRQGSGKGGSVWSTLPYNSKDLQRHLESQWEDWMTWDNYGTGWCIDHIIPQSKLIYDSVDHPNFLRCWALSNLRPLCILENMSKGSYYEGKRYTYTE